MRPLTAVQGHSPSFTGCKDPTPHTGSPCAALIDGEVPNLTVTCINVLFILMGNLSFPEQKL